MSRKLRRSFVGHPDAIFIFANFGRRSFSTASPVLVSWVFASWDATQNGPVCLALRKMKRSNSSSGGSQGDIGQARESKRQPRKATVRERVSNPILIGICVMGLRMTPVKAHPI